MSLFRDFLQSSPSFQKLYLVEWDKNKQCENQLQKLVGRKIANCKMNDNIQRSKEKKPIVTKIAKVVGEYPALRSSGRPQPQP